MAGSMKMARTALTPGRNAGRERQCDPVGGKDVHVAIENQRGRGSPRTNQPLDRGRHAFALRPLARRRLRVGKGMHERRGVCVELQRASERVDHLRRRAPVAALFKPQVVVGADPGEHRQLLAA